MTVTGNHTAFYRRTWHQIVGVRRFLFFIYQLYIQEDRLTVGVHSDSWIDEPGSCVVGEVRRDVLSLAINKLNELNRPNKLLLDVLLRWLNSQIADFVQQGFVTDFQYLGGLAAVPACFFQYVGYDLFLNPVQGCLPDCFK
jgi:hypothetical protein